MESFSIQSAQAAELSKALEDLTEKLISTENLVRYRNSRYAKGSYYSILFKPKNEAAGMTTKDEAVVKEASPESEIIYPEERIRAKRFKRELSYEEKVYIEELDLNQLKRDVAELQKMKQEIQGDLAKGVIRKDSLIRLNEKLLFLDKNYGQIAAVAVTLAAVISGIKDFIDLIQVL
ncbi:hypothetical protein GCM10011571_16640 [Marinithermofilum abyssi]|uniref:Uncharacterized protein n=1 Tax=Marinithermofilum abyssi TaxID=1571185 RepID=A0A8J2VF27_9BACL|nr:hypothetical protein [Marinithermofilum abyssi]GGE15667.1 hypothetical protein GCM10011571_16640 [Marinithermofilum abyssi]